MKKDRKRVDCLTQEDKDNAPILFQNVKKIFAEKKVDKIFTYDLVKYLCELPESRWTAYFGIHDAQNGGRYISKLLNVYGVHSLILRIGRKRLRGYERGHFEKLEPLSYDLLKWLQNDWNSCYVSLGEMWGAGIPTQETLDAIKELESHGWLKKNAPQMNFSKGEYEKVWRIRSKCERDQDRRKKKTVGGIIQSATVPIEFEDWRIPGSFTITKRPAPGEFVPIISSYTSLKAFIEKRRNKPGLGIVYDHKRSEAIWERTRTDIHMLVRQANISLEEKLSDIDVLLACVLNIYKDGLDLEHDEELTACRERHSKYATILIMLSAFLGGFAFWAGTMVGR